ncbi:serine/threonine-protein kinase [Rubrivirga sp. S365]|uniref:serine/threonine-protein kinase n=1 Tax=Rubrivirga sp. S365 TaxID=3076080 RepID=UPI0028CA29DC|nr:serine/threonine-protein kinase [Rubrivirga sp. S365]MDT7858403.1 serine/threonine-protein kinase [Rubrivirga sp. S365]
MTRSPAPRSDGGDAAEPDVLDALQRVIEQTSHVDPTGESGRVDGVLLDLLLGADPARQAAVVETARALSSSLGERAARLARAARDAPEAGFLSRPAAESLAARVADPALAPGDAVGDYRVVREIGRGGMGVVYLAERSDVGLRAALKVLSGPVVDGEAGDPDAERFLDERRHLAALTHPNVARLYDAGYTADGRPYFAMEHVDGEPVTAYADRRGLGLRDRVALFEQVCAAVRHVHGRGLVHGDVKPENVLVADDDEGRPVAKLLDFGVAARWRGAAGGDGASGDPPASWQPFTYGFAAPEIVAGGEPTPASDVYALGVVLRELAAPSATRREPVVAGAVRSLVARSTSDVVGHRPATAHDVLAQVRAIPWQAPAAPRVEPWARGFALGSLAALAGAAAFARVVGRR